MLWIHFEWIGYICKIVYGNSTNYELMLNHLLTLAQNIIYYHLMIFIDTTEEWEQYFILFLFLRIRCSFLHRLQKLYKLPS